jgi:hypothetical protein
VLCVVGEDDSHCIFGCMLDEDVIFEDLSHDMKSSIMCLIEKYVNSN